ncbi:MAG: YggT family protein [Chloroflexi bacterium]|nr:YggT family protein [Chloroflexota bacterium]
MSDNIERTEVVREPPTTTNEVVVQREPEMDHTERVSYDPYGPRRSARYRLVQLVYLIFAVIELLLAVRFVLKALGANANAGFAQFIYAITTPLVAPFLGLFATPASNGMVIEPGTIVALIVYPIVGWIIGKLLWLAFGEDRSAVATRSTTVQH